MATVGSPDWVRKRTKTYRSIRKAHIEFKRDPVALTISWTVAVFTPPLIINPVSVAGVQDTLSAEPPERVLNEAGKAGWEGSVELPRIDPSRQTLYDRRTAGWTVAARAVGVLGPKPAQTARAVQVSVHEAIDRDQTGPSYDPSLPGSITGQQQVSQHHRPKLAAHPVHGPQGLKHGVPHRGRPVASRTARIGPHEPRIKPANEVAIADVAKEKGKGESGLVQAAFPQRVRRQKATSDVGWLGAGARRLAIAAALEMPMAAQLRA